MPDESGAGATDIARKEIAQRMNHLKEQLLALEPQRDERPGRDVNAVAMSGKEEVGHPGQRHDHNVHQKTQHIGMASPVGSITPKGLDLWYDGNPAQSDFPRFPCQDRLLLHRRIDHEFKYLHEQGFHALEWDSVRPGTTLALKLQQASMRVEAISDGVRRYWAAVNSEGMSANQKYQIAGPLAMPIC